LDDNNSNSVVNDSKYFYLAFTMTNMSMMWVGSKRGARQYTKVLHVLRVILRALNFDVSINLCPKFSTHLICSYRDSYHP
jgi:hypothetical protein